MQGAPSFNYQVRNTVPLIVAYPVLTYVPDGVESKRGEWQPTQERLTVPSGAFGVRTPGRFPARGIRGIWRCGSRADHAALAAFLAPLAGRAGAFWCPTFQLDMQLVDASVIGTWKVQKVGYTARFTLDPSAKFLLGFSGLGAVQVAALVTAVVDNGDGTESITYDTSAFFLASSSGTPTTEAARVTGISFLTLARLGSDAITETWHHPAAVDVELSAVSVLTDIL